MEFPPGKKTTGQGSSEGVGINSSGKRHGWYIACRGRSSSISLYRADGAGRQLRELGVAAQGSEGCTSSNCFAELELTDKSGSELMTTQGIGGVSEMAGTVIRWQAARSCQ